MTNGERTTKRVLVIISLVVCCSLGSMAQKYQFPESVKPLIMTRWGQGFPFNVLCPEREHEGETVHDLAGCGALGMAQVINYHQYPKESPDGDYEYDWKLMFNKFNPQTVNREQLVCVAKLISDCGVSSFTKFGIEGSSTNLSSVMGALKRLFRYNNSMCIYRRSDFDTPARDSIFRQMIFEELKAGRPILYRGSDKSKNEGHLFLIDGCKGNKVHVNMGWAGHIDGYYDLDDLYGYSQEQWMLTEVADTAYQPHSTDIRLATAGTLDGALTGEQRMLTRHLRLSGPVDERDFSVMRQMLAEGLLRTIDMEEAEITQLPDSAFANCIYLSHFVAPRTLKNTGYRAFFHCHNLNYVVFHEGLETVGSGAFAGCFNLLAVRLPSTVTLISGNAYNSCHALLSVSLPESVNFIGDYAFANCRNLYRLYLPRNLKYGGRETTKNCPRLQQE